MPIATINPATGQTLETFAALSDAEVNQKLALAERAYRAHRQTLYQERAEKMLAAADILETDSERFAKLMALEMGKPFRAGVEEAMKCASGCRFYAENAARFLADEIIETDAAQSFVRYQSLGPILAIMPWNFPFWQVIRFAAPALMAGNVGLLKHASNVPQCALALEKIFCEAGFADGVFQTLLIGSDRVERVIRDSRVKAVTLTGSEPAGSHVASLAGKLIKKTVLELGGSDPFIVMPSADVNLAARTAVRARTVNSGQSCIAAKRFIIHENIYAEFTHQFVEMMRALKVGNPMEQGTEIGPLATADICETLHRQVETALAAGAQLLTGGKRLPLPGNYYEPTVLARVPKYSPIYHEEIFGPVAMLFCVRDDEEAIALANDSPFGLGASAWTYDPDERERFINEIEAGQVFINAMVASDPRLPFGGIKQSGYGRELSCHGIREFVNVKTVWIKGRPSGGETETE
jgi:succinate-semialdehyde dehydrogenase/glutarate-semialdehyde dehydrogenase